MSPRSKENIIKKIKIEHLLHRVDYTLEKREVGNRIVEYAEHKEEDERDRQKLMKQKSKKQRSIDTSAMKKNKVLDAVAKISILKPAVSAFSVVKSVSLPSNAKVHPNVNYSQVFGASDLQNGSYDLPRINRGIMKHVASSFTRR
jgi:hypothetical protein